MGGERHGSLQVHGHDPGGRGGRVEEEQLPPEVGGLSVPDSCGVYGRGSSSVCHVSPGGRVSESERFFLRRHFSIFFLVFNRLQEKWHEFLLYWRHRRLVLQQFSSFLHDL